MMNANLKNHIQLIENLLNLTDGDPDVQSHILGKLAILYEYSVEKNLAIDNILSVQSEIDKLKMQSANQTDGCGTDKSSDWDSLPESPGRQFKSRSSRRESKRKKAKRHNRRSSSKHNENYKRHSRSRSRGKRHGTSHRKSENRNQNREKNIDDSDTEKYSSFEDLASYSNSQDRHRASGIEYKMKNKYRHPAKSSSSHRDNEKTINSSNSDSSDLRYTARKRISANQTSKRSGRKPDKSTPANMRDQLATILASIINKQNIPSSKVEVSPIKTTGKNASVLSEHWTKKETIEISTVRSTAKPSVEWVDSFDIELAEEINLEIDDEIVNKIDDKMDDKMDHKMDDTIDDEIIQKVIAKSSGSKNEGSSNRVVPNLSFDVEAVKQALATAKMYENKQALAVEHRVKLPFTQSNNAQLSNHPRVQRLKVQNQRRDQRASLSLQVPTFSSPPTQPSNYYERSFYPTESLQSTSGQDHLNYGSLQHTIQSPTVTSPIYSSCYQKPPEMHDKLVRSQNNELERRKRSNELFSVSFKNTETQMIYDEYISKQEASIASAVRNIISETETGLSSDNNTKFNSHRDQRVNYSTYGGYRRSQEVSSTSTNAVTETVTRPTNTHPRFGNVSRSSNNAISNSKVNFEIQNAAREDDILAEIHTTDSVEKQSNLRWAKSSEDSKSQKRVNIKQDSSRCDKNNSYLADVNRSSSNSTYTEYKRNLETILSSTPLNSNRNRGNVCDNNSKPIPKINFKIPKKAISKTLELNEIDDWDLEAETTGGLDPNNANITQTNNNDRLIVVNTEPQVVMQTIESTSRLNENTGTTSSEKENNVTSTSSSVDSKENRDIITAVKELIHPRHFRKIIDLIGKMNKDNSLTKRVEVIEKQTNDAFAEGAESSYTSVDIKNISASKGKKRKNELDRLNEDIDAMFIRDGVLNSTGRRSGSPTKRNAKRNKSVDDFEIGNSVAEKKKSLLRARSNTVMLERKVHNGQGHQPSFQELKSTDLRIEKTTTKRNFAKKSTTKSSQHIENGKRARREVADKQNDPKKAKMVSKPHIKNDNPEWHSLKKVMDCHLCDKPPGLSLVSHYVNFHSNHEVAVSRLAPDVADRLRGSTEVMELKRVKLPGKSFYELKQFCYFCNVYKCLSRLAWINHMAKHTGYYQYKCTICSRKFSEKYKHHKCEGQKTLTKIPQPHFQKENLYAYICDICNFVRFSEAEIKTHISIQHESLTENGFFEKVMFLSLQKKKKKIEEESECDEDYTTETECDEDYTTESEINSETEFEEKSQEESDGDYEWELDEMYTKELEQEYKEEQRKEREEEEDLEELLARQATESSSEEECNEESEDDLGKGEFESVTMSETNTKALESTEIINEQLIVSEANNESIERSNEEMEQEQIVTEGNKELEEEEVATEPLLDSPPTPSSIIVISDDDDDA